jgi:hypothetical protein
VEVNSQVRRGVLNPARTVVLGLAFISILFATACAARRVHDYSFDVTGFIAAEDGTPLQDVEVVLQVDPPVYEGIAPAKTQRLVTSKGAFFFRCLSHSRSTRYSITVRKDGFVSQTVSGTAPPDGKYDIRLKRER